MNLNLHTVPSASIPAQLFAPTGRLRAAINLGNPILANSDPPTGQAVGVSVDLATELARQLGVALELAVVDGAAKSVDAVASGRADVGFFAIDPLRGESIVFTAPYELIEGSYLVRALSPLQDNSAVDAAAHRVAVGQGSAYDLFLSRALQAAQIVRCDGAPGAMAAFEGQNLEVLAGIRQMLEAETFKNPKLRLLPGHFMVIQQAMGCRKSLGEDATIYLRRFVESMKANGFVASALLRHGIQGASVAALYP